MNEKCRLYLITPPKFELGGFTEQLKAAFNGGDVAALQLRMKDGLQYADEDNVRRAAETIIPICAEYDVQFILNDNPKLAKEVGAGGVHIGEDDISVAEARKIVGEDMVIGASCYGSIDKAMIAGEEDADYVAFGAFYETQTKEPRGRPSPEILKIWSEIATIPSVAIGGIKPDNAAPLVKAGADFIAVVTGVWNYSDGAEAAVREYNRVIDTCHLNR